MVACAYFGLASVGGTPFTCTRDPQDRYGFLTEALLAGQLHLRIAPDPALLALPDPYDAGANRRFRTQRRLQDASLFRGRLYYYFGVGPVLALFLPWRELTGCYLPEDAAVPLFMTGAAAFGLATVRAVLRRSQLDPPFALVPGFVALLGLSGFGAFLCRTPDTYETAIAAAAFFASVGTFALAKGALTPDPRPAVLILAGSGFGLAFASRPTHLLDALLMAAASAAWVRLGARLRWRALAACWVPWALLVALVFAYNWRRFGSALEFGMRYQLNGIRSNLDVRNLSPSFLGLNLFLYVLAPPTFDPEFPFVHLIPRNMPARPPGYMTFEAVSGLLFCAPLMLLGACWPFVGAARRRLAAAGGALFAQGVALLLLLATFGWAATRYVVDFSPFLALSAALAWARLDEAARGLGAGRVLLHVAGAVLAGYGVLVNAAAALAGKFGEPAGAVSKAVEQAAAPLQREWLRRTLDRRGNLELEFVLPDPVEVGRSETLLTVGDVYRRVSVCIVYVGRRQLSFALEARGGEQMRSPPIRIRPGPTHRIGIEMGMLMPLDEDAARRIWPGADVDTWKDRLHVTVDGEEVLHSRFDFGAAAPYVEIGSNWFGSRGCPSPFGGRIVEVRRRSPPLRD